MKKKKLNKKQELFCKLYASDKEFFCNGLQSYSEAYNIKLVNKKAVGVCKSGAWRMLTNVDILKRIDEIIDSNGLNDSFVDKQLFKLVNQDADFKAKIQAIKEYNSLKQRIVKRLEISDDTETKDELKEIISMLKNDKVPDNKKTDKKPV